MLARRAGGGGAPHRGGQGGGLEGRPRVGARAGPGGGAEMAVARGGARLAALAAEPGVDTLAVSLADENGCRLAVRETEARLGQVEILITCARIGSRPAGGAWGEP